jgi:sugar (pentulose or hexulose) kinase
MFCGLDLGTTNIKAMLVDENGRVVARSSCPIALTHTADGGVEQDLDDIRGWAPRSSAGRSKL